MKNNTKRLPLLAISRLLLLLMCVCFLLPACARPNTPEQDPQPSENVPPETKPSIRRVGNIRSVCLSDRYQGKSCQSAILVIKTESYRSKQLLRIRFSQPDDQLIGVRVLGRDITPTTDENGASAYCLDMRALGVDVTGNDRGWDSLWVQFFFSYGSLKENQAYSMMVEKYYEEDYYQKEEQHVLGDRGLSECSDKQVSSTRVYGSLSQLYEQTHISGLHLPASVACIQVEYQDGGNRLQYHMADHLGHIFIQQKKKEYLEKKMASYTDHFSKRVIHQKDGVNYYIIGSWASEGDAIPRFFVIYWQIGTTYYSWDSSHIRSFEDAIAIVEDLKTFS